MKICKDCEHFFERIVCDVPLCNHPQSFGPDMVTGQESGPHACVTMRDGVCGQDAALFKARAS